MTQVSFENIEQDCRNNIDFFLLLNAEIMAGSGVWAGLYLKNAYRDRNAQNKLSI